MLHRIGGVSDTELLKCLMEMPKFNQQIEFIYIELSNPQQMNCYGGRMRPLRAIGELEKINAVLLIIEMMSATIVLFFLSFNTMNGISQSCRATETWKLTKRTIRQMWFKKIPTFCDWVANHCIFMGTSHVHKSKIYQNIFNKNQKCTKHVCSYWTKDTWRHRQTLWKTHRQHRDAVHKNIQGKHLPHFQSKMLGLMSRHRPLHH